MYRERAFIHSFIHPFILSIIKCRSTPHCRLANTDFRHPSRALGASYTDILNRKEWGGVAFAAKIVQRQQAKAAREGVGQPGDAGQPPPSMLPQQQQQPQQRYPSDGGPHYYRTFDPRKAFNVTVKDHDSIMDLFQGGRASGRASTNTSRDLDSDEIWEEEAFSKRKTAKSQRTAWLKYMGY